jgi:hypothetical protein
MLRIRATIGGVSHELTATPFVVMLWERKMKTKLSKVTTEGIGVEDLMYMSYEVMKRRGDEVPATFDLFAMSIDDVELLADTADPTPAAPSADQ